MMPPADSIIEWKLAGPSKGWELHPSYPGVCTKQEALTMTSIYVARVKAEQRSMSGLAHAHERRKSAPGQAHHSEKKNMNAPHSGSASVQMQAVLPIGSVKYLRYQR